MSITYQLQRLRTNIANMRQDVSDILDAIRNKGVTVPSGSKLDDVPGLIASISDGGGRTTCNKRLFLRNCTN